MLLSLEQDGDCGWELRQDISLLRRIADAIFDLSIRIHRMNMLLLDMSQGSHDI